MSQDWRSQRERATRFWLRLIVWMATRWPRRLVRLFLYPTVAYFISTSPAARKASREYLRRSFGHEPSFADQWRHFFAFASCTLDRILFLSDRVQSIDVEVHRPEPVRALVARNPGCLLFVAHFGSSESLRVIAGKRGLPLSILLDRKVGWMLTELLEQINPQLANSVIDASERGPALVLKLKETLESGRMVGIMVDRTIPSERSVDVEFLGGKARLPVGPWYLANALQVPIILGFGCYLGDNRYAAHWELFAESVRLPRADREAAIQELAQKYARRLEYYAHLAPYNWFNFYDFWSTDGATGDAAIMNEMAHATSATQHKSTAGAATRGSNTR
jgi:predicted LPLAT superfamily acyltransferase